MNMKEIIDIEVINYLKVNFGKPDFLKSNQAFIVGKDIETGIPFWVKDGKLYSTNDVALKDIKYEFR